MRIVRDSIPMIADFAAKPFKWAANSKLMKMACDKFEITPEKAMAYTTIASIVGKDSIGCYMYVKQSLNNEKIPEEKRSFVAALDLTNGALMIAAQLIMFATISNKKVQNALFGKLFHKVFGDEARKAYYLHMKAKKEFSSKTKEEINKVFDEVKDRTQDTFGFLTSLIASTTIGKRIIVPFIATPLASWAKDKFIDPSMKDGNKKTTENNKKNTQDKNNDVKNNKQIPLQKTEVSAKEDSAVKSDSSNNGRKNDTQKPAPEFKGNLLEKYTTK